MSDELRWSINCAALIEEVKKRPGIYDKSHPDHKKDGKERLWLEICEQIVSNWTKLPLPEQNSKGLIIQRKWKNLRDSFRKELKIQNQVKSSNYPKKKREYLYFKSLQFLEPFLQDSESTSKYSQSNEEYEDMRSSKRKRKNNQSSLEYTQNSESNSSSTHYVRKQVEPPTEQQLTESSTIEKEESESNDLNNIDNYAFHEDIDEDRYFLLSLLSNLRNLSNKQKLAVRIEFLQILQRISFSNDDPLNNS